MRKIDHSTPDRLAELVAARDAGVIDEEVFARLATFLAARASAGSKDVPEPAEAPRFDFTHILYYAGALLVLGAMGIFSTNAFALFGDRALLATALVYGVVFWRLGGWLWRRGRRTPGGLLIACAVGMAPLGVFALQSLAGFSPAGEGQTYRDFYVWVKSSWLPMELGTIAAALIALLFYPFPFLLMIASFSLWFMSMDIAPWLVGLEALSIEQRATVSLCFGLVMMAAAWLVDLKYWEKGDFAFWLHLFGLIAFWGGLSAQQSDSGLGKAIYCAINVSLILLSAFLARRSYAVFGAVGVTGYLGYLASDLFRDSALFPFALSALGLALIGFGLLYRRYEARVIEALRELLPDYVQALRPARARLRL
jgi:hypothetical protein